MNGVMRCWEPRTLWFKTPQPRQLNDISSSASPAGRAVDGSPGRAAHQEGAPAQARGLRAHHRQGRAHPQAPEGRNRCRTSRITWDTQGNCRLRSPPPPQPHPAAALPAWGALPTTGRGSQGRGLRERDRQPGGAARNQRHRALQGPDTQHTRVPPPERQVAEAHQRAPGGVGTAATAVGSRCLPQMINRHWNKRDS